MLHTSLHSWHAAHGAKLVDFAGWHMPVLYTSLVEEHHAVRQRVGLFDVAHMGRLRFDGPDALPFLEQVLTTDCGKLAIGDVKYSLVCQEDGGILDDVLLYRRDHCWQLVVNASNREKLLTWFGQQQVGRDIGLIDETLTTCMIAVQGAVSRFRDALRRLGAQLDDKSWAIGVDLYRLKIGDEQLSVFSDEHSLDIEGSDGLVQRVLREYAHNAAS